MMVIYFPVKSEFDWTKRFFELESGNENVDGQTDKRTDGITPISIGTWP